MTSMPFTRRAAAGVIATLALAVTGCNVDTGSTGGEGAEGEGQTLTVTAFAGAWSDTFTEAFVEPFEERTGATVQFVPGGGAEWLTQLRAANGENPPYDLVALTPDLSGQAARAEVLEPLQTDRISNWDELSPVLVEQAGVDGTTYGMPLTTGSTGLAYRTDLIDTPPKDWSDLMNPEYCGHVGLPPLTYNPGLEMLAGLANEQGGTLGDPAANEQAMTSLAELQDCVSTYPADSGAMQTALQNGDAWIAPWWDGRAFAMEQEGAEIGFVYPESGAVGALTSYYLAAGSDQSALAYEFLSEMSKPENMKVFAEGTWYGAANTTIEYSDTFASRIEYGDEVYSEFAWVDYPTVLPQLTGLQEEWNEMFA